MEVSNDGMGVNVRDGRDIFMSVLFVEVFDSGLVVVVEGDIGDDNISVLNVRGFKVFE